MNIILLSGGSGKRLWPLSNESRSKQFLKLLKNDQGIFESMVQRVYGQIKRAGINADILVATSSSQADSIRNQLGNNVEIVLEPERRDTFPAIALSCTYLYLEKNVDLDEVILVMPVDLYADMEYLYMLPKMEEAARNTDTDLVLMGINPTYPSSKYGYILPAKEAAVPMNESKVDVQKQSIVYKVERFIEKPSEEAAGRLISSGAVWNGGVFAFRLKYLVNIVQRYLQDAGILLSSFIEINNNYNVFKKISFDYEVVEHAASIRMLLYQGCWKDLGTWNMLSEEMYDNFIGQVTIGEDTLNTTIINELSIPIIALGLKDMVVAASPDGILITDKKKSSYLKPYVDQVSERPMYVESIWGDYKVFDYHQYEDKVKSLTKYFTIKTGQFINYQAHRIRDEIWTIVSGEGDIVIDGIVKKVGRGDAISITKGQKHAIKARDTGDLHYIEVQIGTELAEEDFEIFEWQWEYLS